MVPSRFALAMQADGWVLRSAITWVKTSPMPESIQGTRWERCKVKTAEGKSPARNLKPELGRGLQGGVSTLQTAEWADCPGCPKCEKTDGLVLRRGSGRPTNATEMLFVFVKKMGAYYWDLEATRVQSVTSAEEWVTKSATRMRGEGKGQQEGVYHPHKDARPFENGPNPAGRNAWNWMTFKSAPSSLDHFAGFPPELPEFCIEAGTSQAGCCPICQAPYARVVERTAPSYWSERQAHDFTGRKAAGTPLDGYKSVSHGRPENSGVGYASNATLGWRPTCACPVYSPVPATVMDCFSGSGTTLMVADRLGRNAIGVELKSDYANMSQRRVVGDSPLFADVQLEGADDDTPAAPVPDGLTKQERCPNRTVAGFNQRWKTKHGAATVEGASG